MWDIVSRSATREGWNQRILVKKIRRKEKSKRRCLVAQLQIRINEARYISALKKKTSTLCQLVWSCKFGDWFLTCLIVLFNFSNPVVSCALAGNRHDSWKDTDTYICFCWEYLYDTLYFRKEIKCFKFILK